MKQFLPLVLVLVCLSGWGATRDNPWTTNTASVVTNITQSLNPFQTRAFNTNDWNYTNATIVATISGDATAAGTYYFREYRSASVIVFTNGNAGPDWIVYDRTTNAILSDVSSAYAMITNSSIPDTGSFDGVLYDGDPWSSSAWTSENGGGTATQVKFNLPVATYVVATYYALTLSNNPVMNLSNKCLHVDQWSGNDTLGWPGTSPFKTLHGAVGRAASNDVIVLGPGVFTEASATGVSLPQGVSLIGAGRGLTRLNFPNPTLSNPITMNGNATMANMSIYGIVKANNSSNFFFNVEATGDIDAVALSGIAGGFDYFEDCSFKSGWDVFLAAGSGSPLSVFYLKNCLIYANTNLATNTPSTSARGLDSTTAKVIMDGGTIEAYNGSFLTTCVQSSDANGQIELKGTKLYTGSTNAGATPLMARGSLGGAGTSNIKTYGFSIPDNYISSITCVATNLLPGNSTNFTTYAAGTAYTLTASSAALTFGTTQPVLTINQAGTYKITGKVGIKYSGATYVGAQTITLKFRRTNNTAADLTNGSRAVELPVLTTFTGGDVMPLPDIVYTAASGDTVTIFGILTATPSAGSVQADSAELMAIRLY